MEIILKRRTKFGLAIIVPMLFLKHYALFRRHNTIWTALKSAGLLCMALFKS